MRRVPLSPSTSPAWYQPPASMSSDTANQSSCSPTSGRRRPRTRFRLALVAISDAARRCSFIVGEMQASEVSRAVVAAMSVASSVDLTVDDVIVLHNSNRLTLRLLPSDVLARVAPVAHQVAQFEVELAQRLAESECPVATVEPRVAPRVYERDGFVVTLWTY